MLQTLGAGLGPDKEEGGTGGVEHKIIPWGYSVYRQVPSVTCHAMSRVTCRVTDPVSRHGDQPGWGHHHPGHVLRHRLGGRLQVGAPLACHVLHVTLIVTCHAAGRYTQDAPEVVVQMLLSRRAEMTEVK